MIDVKTEQKKRYRKKPPLRIKLRMLQRYLRNHIHPSSWRPKTRKIVFTAVAIVVYLIFRLFLYPNSDAVLKAIGLSPKDFISPEVYGGAIQSLVTGLTVLATFYIYNRSKRDALSQKVYDKKFETYCLLWEELQGIEKDMPKDQLFDTSALNKQVTDFYDLVQSKFLILSDTVHSLFTYWTLCAFWHLDCCDVSLSHQLEVAEKARAENALYFDKQREKFKKLIAEAMKKELGLEKLEKEINLSIDYDLTDDVQSKALFMMNKVMRENGYTLEARRQAIDLTKKQLAKSNKQSDEQTEDHLTESNDQEKSFK